MQVLSRGAMLLGAVLAGGLAAAAGLRVALTAGALVLVLGAVWLLRTLRVFNGPLDGPFGSSRSIRHGGLWFDMPR